MSREPHYRWPKMSPVKSGVSLGSTIDIGKTNEMSKANARLANTNITIDRTQRLRASNKAKRCVIRGKAIPQATHGSSICTVPNHSCEVTATKVINTLWGKTFGMRCREMVWLTPLEPWLFHPFWASIDVCFQEVLRTVVKCPTIKIKFQRVLETRVEQTSSKCVPGPANNIKAAAVRLEYSFSPDGVMIREGEEDIPIFGQDPRWVTRRIREAIRAAIARDLSFQVSK